ncbi:MAG: tetratricopeptide repeat protein [Planctomycetota bacterium]
MTEMPASRLLALLDAEENLPAYARTHIRPIAMKGIVAAQAAVSARPDDACGHLVLGLNLGMLGISLGKVDAFLSGVPPRVMDAYKKAIELDETCESAGPLQLKGRFHTIVPWPYRDLKKARISLERAAEIARVKQTLFFLGDVYARRGEFERAERTWREALDAPAHPPAEPLAPHIDRLIQRRLKFVSGTASPRR